MTLCVLLQATLYLHLTYLCKICGSVNEPLKHCIAFVNFPQVSLWIPLKVLVMLFFAKSSSFHILDFRSFEPPLREKLINYSSQT